MDLENNTSSYIEQYEGPVYYYGSNQQGTWNNSYKVLYSQELKLDKVNNKYY
jgi:hypothetical protein